MALEKASCALREREREREREKEGEREKVALGNQQPYSKVTVKNKRVS